MCDELNLHLFTLTSLADHSAAETQRFFNSQDHEPCYAYELFRRAIIDQNQYAWEIIYIQYRPLVTKWVMRHPASETTGEEPESLVNSAFEKLWISLTADKFGNFPDLKSVLRYLKMCVHSCIIDQVRVAERIDLDILDEGLAQSYWMSGSSTEDEALDRLHLTEFWHALNAEMHDQKERLVIFLSAILGLRPREICGLLPHIFPNVDELYRVKQNVLARLRRNPELRKFLINED